MRTSRSIWSLFQNVSHKNNITGHGSRARSAAVRKKDVFDASKLVLDLEAADSKYVRKFEEDFKDNVILVPAKPKRLSSSEVKHLRELESQAPQTTLDIFQATPPDYLCYTLLGDPFSLGVDSQHDLRQVFKRNGLAPRQGRFSDNIKWLRDNAISVPSPQSDQFISKLRGCSDIHELRRSISLIAGTQVGCRLLASNGQLIVDLLEAYEPTALLKSINALVQLLETKGVDPGPALVEAGLYHAANEGLLSPLEYYIAKVSATNYAVGKQRGDSIVKLTDSVVSGRFGEGVQGATGPLHWGYGRAGQWQRRDALRLLTGWAAEGVPKENEKRKVSFATIIHNDRRVYRCYIEALATFQAGEALLYELTHPDPVSISDHELARLFSGALIKAGGVQLALQACNVLANSSGDDFAVETPERVSTPLQHISNSENEEQIIKFFLAHYGVWCLLNLQKYNVTSA